MNKKYLFLQPIVSHYRKSVVKRVSDQIDTVEFWGTSNFEGVEPLNNTHNIKNDLTTAQIIIQGKTFRWYKRLLTRMRKYNPDIIVFSGFNPLLLNFTTTFLWYKLFSKKKTYWWSQGKPSKQGVIGKFIRKTLYNLSDGILLYSKQGETNFINAGVNPSKLFVINNCLNDEDYGYKQYDIKKKKQEFCILYSGRLSKRKNISILLDALSVVKNKYKMEIPLHIIGDGPETNNLKNQTENYRLNKITFHGELYGENVHSTFLNSSLFVCPGAVGLSIVHAFSFGLPIITARGDEAHSSELELLEENKNGGFFELGNPESLAKEILLWKEKIEKDEMFSIMDSCIDSIIKNKYLPEDVATKIINTIAK